MIEEEYAKRLSKLAKQQLGKDEIGCVIAFYGVDLWQSNIVIWQGATEFIRYVTTGNR